MVATPIAAWWLIGDQTFTGGRREHLDYMYSAPSISGRTTATAGVIALVAVAAAIAGLSVAARRHLVDPRGLGVVALLMLAGVLLAGVGRIVTAGVVGANIGGGLAIFFGAPTVVALMVCAALRARWILRHPVGVAPQ